jgi:hypothetical protein
MRFTQIVARAVAALTITVLLNGALVAAFNEVAASSVSERATATLPV